MNQMTQDQLQLFKPVSTTLPVPASQLEIVAVGRYLFGDRVQPQRYGPNDKGLCVFHQERTPSFYLKPELNMFKCYGCGRFGGPISLILETAQSPYDTLYALSRLDILGEEGRSELWDALLAEESRFKSTLVSESFRRIIAPRD